MEEKDADILRHVARHRGAPSLTAKRKPLVVGTPSAPCLQEMHGRAERYVRVEMGMARAML